MTSTLSERLASIDARLPARQEYTVRKRMTKARKEQLDARTQRIMGAEQFGLWDHQKPDPPEPKIQARRSDPESSKAAAEAFEEAHGNRLRTLVLSSVRMHPGLTAVDLDEKMELRETARKRLPELRKSGLVFSTQEGKNPQRWWYKDQEYSRFPTNVAIRDHTSIKNAPISR